MTNEKLAARADLDALTFVAVGRNGDFIEEIRTYQGLWDICRRYGCTMSNLPAGMPKAIWNDFKDRFAVDIDVFVDGVTTPDNAPGEKEVVAAIVPKAGAFDASTAFSICKTKLEANFVPTYLQVVPKIPKTASEKPRERFLLEEFDVATDNIHTN